MNDLEQDRKWVSADTLQRLSDALAMGPFMLLLPQGHEEHVEAFTLLADYATKARKGTSAAIDDLLHEICAKKRYAVQGPPPLIQKASVPRIPVLAVYQS